MDYIALFQEEFIHILKQFCGTLIAVNVNPKCFFDTLPHFTLQWEEYGEELNKKDFKLFARGFYEYVLNDILTDVNTYKIYFDRNGSFKMIMKQFNLMWPEDPSLQEKQIAAFYEFALALEYFLFNENETRDEYFNQLKDNEEKVQEMLANIHTALKSLMLQVFDKFVIKYFK
jgi:hypothetical protein